MATEGTFTELRQKKADELREMLRLIEDPDALKNLKAEEATIKARLIEVQRQILTYQKILDIGQPKPVAAPHSAAPASAPGAAKTKKPRVNREELNARIVTALGTAGSQGLSVKDLADKIGYGYQSLNTYRKTPEMQKMLESTKDGTSIYLTLKPGFKEDSGAKRGNK